MMEVQFQIGEKILFQRDCTPNRQVRLVKFGPRSHLELSPVRSRVNVEISNTLLVHREVFAMNVRLDRRRLASAAGLHPEINQALGAYALRPQLRKPGKTQVASGKIKTKLIL